MITANKTYNLEGRILAACTCNPCSCSPCDCTTYDSFVAYRIERGEIKGLDVSGVTLAKVVRTTGNVKDGNCSAVVYVDDKASSAQQEALLRAFNGELGGPLADLANLVNETPEVRVVPIDYSIDKGRNSLPKVNWSDFNLGWEESNFKVTQNKFCFAA